MSRTQIITRDIQDAFEAESILYAGIDKKAIWKKLSDVIGDATNISYVHEQNTPSDTWVINHNLGFTPQIRIVNSAGDTVMVHTKSISLNTDIAEFDGNNTGTAYCS